MKMEGRGDKRALQAPIAHMKLTAHMRGDGEIDIIEMTIANKIGAADELFLGGRPEDLEGALDAVPLHRATGRDGRCDEHRAVAIMSLAMAGRAHDNRGRLHSPGLLGIVGIGVIFRMDGQHRRDRTIGGAKSGWEPADAALNGKARLLKQRGHQTSGLELLHSQFAEIENVIVQQSNGPRMVIQIALDLALDGGGWQGFIHGCAFRS